MHRVKAVSIIGYPIYPSRPGPIWAALARPPAPEPYLQGQQANLKKPKGAGVMVKKSINSNSEGTEKGKQVQVVRVEMVKERTVNFTTNKISSPRDAALILADFLAGVDREHLVVLCLDSKNKVNAINVVGVGTLSSALVHPREVFKPAILSNAAAVLVGHNHPSGDPTPSKEDMEIAKRLEEAGKILGIELLDSLVVGDDGIFVSMKERGLL